MAGMTNRRWGRRLVAAFIWSLAMLTWGSIGYHLFELPDLGPLLAIVAVVVVLAWPEVGTEASRVTTRAESAPPSRA